MTGCTVQHTIWLPFVIFTVLPGNRSHDGYVSCCHHEG